MHVVNPSLITVTSTGFLHPHLTVTVLPSSPVSGTSNLIPSTETLPFLTVLVSSTYGAVSHVLKFSVGHIIPSPFHDCLTIPESRTDKNRNMPCILKKQVCTDGGK